MCSANLVALTAVSVLLLACAREKAPAAIAPVDSESPLPASSEPKLAEQDDPVPKHLEHFPGLSVRRGTTIVDAPPADIAVAKGYPNWRPKGPKTGGGGERLTIMTAKTTYAPGEKVRVIHVYEATNPGLEVYVMGPKPIAGESIDGKLVTPPSFAETGYDGAVMKSPWADYNYDVTEYALEPGRHQIQWKSGTYGSPRVLESNVLEIEVR